MAHEHEIPLPQPSPCPECHGERFPAAAINSVRLTALGTALPGITGGFTEMYALVCANCGYTMFYAKDPSHIHPRK